MDSQKFCLKWDNFQGSVTSLFDSLRLGDELVDITLCCAGQQVRAHRIMLSACSPYFREVLKGLPYQQTAFFLKDTSAEDLQAIVEFMYRGSVNVSQSQLAGFMRTAETLQIRGLSGDDDKQAKDPGTRAAAAGAPARAPPSLVNRSCPGRPPPSPAPPRSPASKRRRLSTAVAAGEPQVIDCVSPDPDTALSAAHPQQQQQQQASYDAPPPNRPFQQVGASSPLPLRAQYSAATQPPPAAAADSCAAGQLSTAAAAADVKVEKVEPLSGDEGSDSLGAALEQASEYDESSSTFGEEYSSMEMGADESMGYNVQTRATGSSQHGAVGEDGSQQGRYSCKICGKRYKSATGVSHHKHLHEGSTKCHICQKVLSNRANLRTHLMSKHKLSRGQVRRVVLTTYRGRARN